MKYALIGNTGFVGSNLLVNGTYGYLYNSSNITEISGLEFDRVVCAGARAEKWLANQDPERDREGIEDLMNPLRKVHTEQFILISTIDVYPNPINVDEYAVIDKEQLAPYGRNRFELEEFIRDKFKNHLIIRLPALFGKGLKKNFIYDLINPVPRVIIRRKFKEITDKLDPSERSILEDIYEIREHYYLKEDPDISQLREAEIILGKTGFTSRAFTHADSLFQYYNLKNLSKDIEVALNLIPGTVNICSEPIVCRDLALETLNMDFTNLTERPPVHYQVKSRFSHLWNTSMPYQYSSKTIILEIRDFIRSARIR